MLQKIFFDANDDNSKPDFDAARDCPCQAQNLKI